MNPHTLVRHYIFIDSNDLNGNIHENEVLKEII
jgi:hypothetical protein